VAGPIAAAVAYVYSENRQAAHPQRHLAAFAGVLQVGGYAGFKALANEQKERKEGAVQFAFCWAHARRKFFDFHHATGSPIAAEALRRIAELYQIEARIRGRPPEQRAQIRQAERRSLIEAMKTWLDGELARVSAKSALAEAIRYALRHWNGLSLLLEDGRVEIDSNTVERTIRPIKPDAKNHLFAGCNGGAESWAVIASMIQTAKLNRIEPLPISAMSWKRSSRAVPKPTELSSLLPWVWRTSQTQAAVNS
jgi:transposase